MNGLLDRIARSPLITHPVLAALYTLALALGLTMVSEHLAPTWAASVVLAIFVGREAGQREHDLKNAGWSPIGAWLGVVLLFGWSRANALEAAAAAGGAIGMALALYAIGWAF